MLSKILKNDSCNFNLCTVGLISLQMSKKLCAQQCFCTQKVNALGLIICVSSRITVQMNTCSHCRLWYPRTQQHQSDPMAHACHLSQWETMQAMAVLESREHS